MIRILSLLFFVHFPASWLHAQCNPVKRIQQAEPISIECLQEKIATLNDDSDFAKTQIKMWANEIKKSSAIKSIKLLYFDILIEQFERSHQFKSLVPFIFYEKGKWLHSDNGDDLPGAIEAFSTALKILKSNHPIDSFFISRCLIGIGSSQYYHGDLISSEQTMLLVANGRWPTSRGSLANVFQTLGLIYQAKGNIPMAEQYFYQSGTKYIEAFGDSLYFADFALNSIGLLHTDFSNYERAIDNYSKALQIVSRTTEDEQSKNYLSTKIRGNLAAIYSYSNKFDEALQAYQHILKIYEKTAGLQDIMLTKFNIGTINVRKGELVLAEKQYNELDSMLSIQKNVSLENLLIDNRAHLQWIKGNFELSIQARKKQLEDLCQIKLTDCLITSWSEIETDRLVSIANILPNVSVVYVDRFRSQKNIADLDSALLIFITTQSILDQIKLNQFDPEFSADLGALNARLLEDVLSMYPDKPEWTNHYYTFFEKAKSTSLLASMHSSHIETLFSNKSPQIKKVHQIKINIDSIQDLLDNTEDAAIADQHRDRILELNQELVHANEAKQKLLISQNELTDLYDHVELEELQKSLDEESCMISYFVNHANDKLFILYITKYDVEIFTKKVYSQFKEDVFRLINMPTKNDDQKSAWIESNNRLSELLLGDILSDVTGRLNIIPDGILAYIPFEMLFTQQSITTASYASLPYLIKEKSISYNFSASIWKEMSDKEISGKGLLTMAPEFSMQTRIGNSNAESAVPLAHAKKEVHAINSIFKSKFQPSTKEEFIRDAAQAQIVHFAGHAILNDNRTENSYLAFSSSDDREDKLYIRDIYNMRTPNELVVLSACNTGQGELKKGEGVMSMARAFAYSGAKSLVYSLWDVNDGSTKKIMERFYIELKAGATKDDALRTAKLAYLEGAKGALQQPFYWAGFVAMGDMAPIESGGLASWMYALGLLLGLGLLIFIFRRLKLVP